MTFVVTEACIKCKYTDCVEVCPVDCFYEGPDFLVISPDECIDCGLCEPECPIEAIVSEDELPEGQIEFIEINAKLADVYPNISEAKEPHPEAEKYKDIKEKKHFLKLDANDEDNKIASSTRNQIYLYSSGEIIVNESKLKINTIDNIEESLLKNILLDNLTKNKVIYLSIEGKAYHEWAMKIMKFLQQHEFHDIKLKTIN